VPSWMPICSACMTSAQSVEGGPWMSIYDHLEFKHFKYIVAIAEAGTFTAAAIHLPLAQSALSRQISEMEDALGVHIFDRSRGGSTLTDAGESLLRFARELLQTRVEIVNAIQAIQQASLHPFRIGFTPFVEQHVIGTVCRAYKQIFPRALLFHKTAIPRTWWSVSRRENWTLLS
jgi:DNA-binding transcriptional LysR family regulator